MNVDTAKQWSLDWHIPLNDEKCVHMSFGGDPANAFVMRGEKGPENIIRIDAKKDLGIWVSSNLSFSLHRQKSAQNAFAILQMIRRTFSRITRMDFQTLYRAYLTFNYPPPRSQRPFVARVFRQTQLFHWPGFPLTS
ncbi:hypothetical protein T265_10676 [Opisthorchis viverrini]|uniref:Reverse transcriptase domain-containing protein n=1 Tax=Opisthorchis viverrini TaxID=6198 RepID=A0A075A0B9_OPIVI|nr:hypothetical protein T265_10676 [Opisthorchis viverrini]KER20869.1 hypothetical protein T265_10676 [Opisthorchis viverrini]